MTVRQHIITVAISALLCIPFSGLGAQPLHSAQSRQARAADNMLIDAVSQYADGNYPRAAEILRHIIKVAPGNDAAHYYLALAAFMQHDFELAEKELDEAVRLDGGNFWYRYRLAALYSYTDRPELTIDMYEALLRDFPTKSELYYNLAELYISQGMLDKALEVLSQIETVFGKNEATAMMRFNLLDRSGKPQEAYSSLEEFNKEYSSAQVLSVLGDYNMSQYNDSTALVLYNEALDIVPGYAPALLGKTEVYRMTRRYDEYFVQLDQFIRNDDIAPQGKGEYLKAIVTHSDPNFMRAFKAELDSAVTTFMHVHPSDSAALTVAGIYYYATDRGEEAVKCFRENMQAWPQSLSAAAGYTELLAYLKKWDELSVQGRKSFADFGDAYFLDYALMADYNAGRYDDVISLCDTIILFSAGDSSQRLGAYVTKGDVYYLTGDSAKAFKAYEKAMKVNPDHLPLLNNYAYYLSLSGKKLKKALSMSAKTVEAEPDNPTYLDTYGWILYLLGRPQDAKPYFKHAMLYGGKDSAVVLDHYAQVLYALQDYRLALVYWNQAAAKDTDGKLGTEEKIKECKTRIGN